MDVSGLMFMKAKDGFMFHERCKPKLMYEAYFS